MLKILRNLFYCGLVLGILLLVALFLYAHKLERDYNLAEELDGSLWALPARVYARPMELYDGAKVSLADIENELNLLKFQKLKNDEDQVLLLNQYQILEEKNEDGNFIVVNYYADSFQFWDELVDARNIKVYFNKNNLNEVFRVDNVSTLEDNIDYERLNPLHIASIYPQHKQDRLLVRLDEVPPILIDTLLSLEDRNFYSHYGVDFRGIARAFYVTVIQKSGKQGASTITQQFIKNHYLSNEQTISRKVKEILMAFMLEKHRTKEQILEAYLNEIYLGQDGQRAIHGFGLASEYYFNKKLMELDLHEIAMLLALVREPSIADPRKRPEYALQRRDFILQKMYDHYLIDERTLNLAQSLPLDVVSKDITSDRLKFPHFVDLVFQQLAEEYSKEDLTRDGLIIFTSLDPQIQQKVQQALSDTVAKIEVSNGLSRKKTKKNPNPKPFLQGATIVTDIATGEVVAISGSRVANELGYNRALHAKRQVGSILKPAVYLSALEYPNDYNIHTPLSNRAIKGKWSPRNFTKDFVGGFVPLDRSLIKSLNIPTARIALNLGIEDIISTLNRLGMKTKFKPYPSLSLGAVELNLLEMAQMYETIANDGYLTPVRSIREIITADGTPIKRFETQSIQAIFPGPHYLLVSIMQRIPTEGTAKGLYDKSFPSSLNIAGKTGTTDNYRDSWFAGFSGNYVTIAWVGNDDNKPTKLTGGKGGMVLWKEVMKQLDLKPLQLKQPEEIVFKNVHPSNHRMLAGSYCSGRRMPFIKGFEPIHYQNCKAPPPPKPVNDDDGDGWAEVEKPVFAE